MSDSDDNKLLPDPDRLSVRIAIYIFSINSAVVVIAMAIVAFRYWRAFQ